MPTSPPTPPTPVTLPTAYDWEIEPPSVFNPTSPPVAKLLELLTEPVAYDSIITPPNPKPEVKFDPTNPPVATAPAVAVFVTQPVANDVDMVPKLEPARPPNSPGPESTVDPLTEPVAYDCMIEPPFEATSPPVETF